MVNSMDRTVLFADVLGFSTLSKTPGAQGAADALSDLAFLLSSDDELAKLLQSPVWAERYGLSDSIFLVAEDPVRACAAAAELFFNLSYVNHTADSPVLLRGGIAIGEAVKVGPIFPESAKSAEGATALKISGLKEEAPALEGLLSTPETILLDRLRSLTR